MEPHVRALHTDTVHAAVARAVGVSPDALRSLGGFESFVYETVVEEAPRIVKATWHGRRTTDEMGAELHFVNYLADRGAPVCRALPLADGRLIATVPAAELVAFDWYKQLIVEGAREHRLPEYYVTELEALAARPDPSAQSRNG